MFLQEETHLKGAEMEARHSNPTKCSTFIVMPFYSTWVKGFKKAANKMHWFYTFGN